MNTAELIYQEVLELPEYARLEMLKNIQLTKEKLGFLKKPKTTETIATDDKSEQIYNLMCQISDNFQKSGRRIDIDEFEKSRQDRELDR